MNPISSRKRPRHDSDTGARALTNGLRRGKSLWSQEGQQAMASLSLALHAAHRGTELQASYRQLDAQISQPDERVMDQAFKRFGAKLLMTHPGVGPITVLATEVFLGDPTRFADGKALPSYVGMIPGEYSSGGRQRLGALSKQGNPFLRYLWCLAVETPPQRRPLLVSLGDLAAGANQRNAQSFGHAETRPAIERQPHGRGKFRCQVSQSC